MTQPTKEESDTPNTDMHVTTRVDAMGESTHVVDADFARELERENQTLRGWHREAVDAHSKIVDELIDLRASLRREENARKVLADTNERLRSEVMQLQLDRQHIAELISGHDGYVFQDIARALGIQADEEKS